MKLSPIFEQILEERGLLTEKQILYSNGANYGQAVFLAGGAGCLAKDTGVIMSDGSVKKVQHITSGDKVSGPDGSPRTVERLHRGREKMLRVTTVKGDTYVCNKSHVHSFVCSFDKCGFEQGEIYNMTYDEWKSIPKSAKKALKLYKSEEVEFTEINQKNLPISPYVLGLWLGDGVTLNTNIIVGDGDSDVICEKVRKEIGKKYNFQSVKSGHTGCKAYSITSESYKNTYRSYLTKECTNQNGDKIIPLQYLNASPKVRRQVLAGLIDSDGYNGGKYYEIVTKLDSLKDGIMRLSNSLGLKATCSIKSAEWKGEIRNYHRISISGDLENVPVSLKRKSIGHRKQVKNVNRFGYSFTELPEDDYFGFQIKEDDKRFLLENYIVTHNSGKGFALENFMERKKFRVIDVDEYKKLYLKWSQIANNTGDISTELGVNDPLDLKKLQRAAETGGLRVYDAYPELGDLNLRNPEDVSKLHFFVKRRGIKPKIIQNLLKNSTPNRLPNIMFDTTAKDMDDLTDVLPKLKDVGYRSDSIHITWILANYSIAVDRNQNRPRIVPSDILLQTHEGAAKTMIEVIKGGTPSGIDGAVRVVLNNPEHTVKHDRVATGTGEEVIKDFKYLTLKEAGKPFKAESEVQQELFYWIKNNIPKTVELWRQMSDN